MATRTIKSAGDLTYLLGCEGCKVLRMEGGSLPVCIEVAYKYANPAHSKSQSSCTSPHNARLISPIGNSDVNFHPNSLSLSLSLACKSLLPYTPVTNSNLEVSISISFLACSRHPARPYVAATVSVTYIFALCFFS